MVDVFKTNVQHPGQARRLIALLHRYFPDTSINFDLEDCDKVLRIEGPLQRSAKVTTLVRARGFTCVLLE